ncbi:MAG: hypothetical protein U0359_36985 [Byssovorax sp.]
MKFTKTLATLILATASFGLAGCGGGGVEGTYKLDKAEVKKSMEAEVAKLPADQQGFAKLGIALIDAMDMSMELQAGGKLKMKASSPSLDPAKAGKTDEKEGTWKLDGNNVTLDSGDGKPLTCTRDGNKLNCAGAKKGDPALVFVKG